MSAGRILLLLMVFCFALPRVVHPAAIDVQFRPQNGTVQTATEWAMEMHTDTPIGSTGIFIANVSYLTGFTSATVGGTPVIGLPGVLATVNAKEDPTAPWGIFNATWFGLPAGLLINAGPGFLAGDLGPPATQLALGMLHGATRTDIMWGEGVESGLWADPGGSPIPASDVHYITPEPGALMLLGLALCALVLLRYSSA